MIVLPLLAVLLQQADSTGQSALDTTVMLEAAVDKAPRILNGPHLIYPLELLQNNKQGMVVVQFILDTTGRAEPSTIRVIATPHLGFNISAKDYVKNARFSPGEFQGRKVRTLVQFPVVFRMGRGP
jgi:TonB family protein